MPDAEPGALSLRTFALAAVAARVPARETPEAQFLHAQLDAVKRAHDSWRDALESYLQEPAVPDAPLLLIARALELDVVEALTVAVAAAVDEDLMVGRALAYVQAPVGGSRPTLGLLAASFDELDGVHLIQRIVTGNAVACGLLQVLNEGAPLPERAVNVPLHLGLALRGLDGELAGTSIGLDETRRVELPPSVSEQAGRHARSLSYGNQRTLVIRAGSTREGRAVASTVAENLRARPLFIETDKIHGVTPWLGLRGLLPVFCVELAPGERKIIPSLPLYHGPLLVVCGMDGTIEPPGGSALHWTLSVPPRGERLLLWERALGNPDAANELAMHQRHSSGRIAQLGELARQHSALDGRAEPTLEDVIDVAWRGEGDGLEGLAQPLTDRVPDDALVKTPELARALDALLQRCRLRDCLADGLGAAARTRYHPGVRALLVGPSGTGKTLAAGWLATQLGLPLYRVDLAAVTSKYIGETEKNLAQLLTRAEQAGVILLFDEADSLFGKRTDIKDANDRFANAQTNYLLQRIETYDGITLLTSNSRARFDPSFARRLDTVIEFPLPGPQERRALWQAHLGAAHALSPRDLNQLAAAADLTGGHIRNVVLRAAVHAQAEQRALEFGDILYALASEYDTLGRQVPDELRANGAGRA